MLTESMVREEVIRVARQASESGLSPGRSGNVSARCGEGFLITPTGMSYEGLKPSDIVFLSADGEAAAGQRLPSSEWRFHMDIYRQHEDVGAVVHCHSRHATVLACAGLSIPAFHYMVAAAGGKAIPLAPYALFGTQALSDHITTTLDGYRAALLEHHGLIATGADLQSAYELAEEVEELAAQYVLVRALGSDRVLNDVQMDEVVERFKTYGKQDREAE